MRWSCVLLDRRCWLASRNTNSVSSTARSLLLRVGYEDWSSLTTPSTGLAGKCVFSPRRFFRACISASLLKLPMVTSEMRGVTYNPRRPFNNLPSYKDPLVEDRDFCLRLLKKGCSDPLFKNPFPFGLASFLAISRCCTELCLVLFPRGPQLTAK